MLGADDVDRAVSFWSSVFGYRPVRFPDAEDKFTILVPPSGEGTRVADPEGNCVCVVDASHG